MRCLLVPALVTLGAVSVACGVDPGVTPPAASQPTPRSAIESVLAATPTASGPGRERQVLPSGFPILPGAVPSAMANDDPGLIALWSTQRQGSAAYDFYVAALPGAGYPIVGLYPGGDVAAIRFRVPDGAIWQMVARGGTGATTAIEIRLDRP